MLKQEPVAKALMESFRSIHLGTHSVYLFGMLLKPEAFKSNNLGYIRGKSTHNLSTPEWVEVVNLKFFNTSGVANYPFSYTMDVTMDIGL